MTFINTGFGNMVSRDRIVSIVSPASAPIKRLMTEARAAGILIDATYGRRTRSVLVMDSEHLLLTPLQPETISQRVLDRD